MLILFFSGSYYEISSDWQEFFRVTIENYDEYGNIVSIQLDDDLDGTIDRMTKHTWERVAFNK